MKKWIIISFGFLLIAGLVIWQGGTDLTSQPSHEVESGDQKVIPKVSEQPVAVIKSDTLPASTTQENETILNTAQNTASHFQSAITEKICLDTSTSECQLREDVTILDTLFYDKNTITDNVVSVIMQSENFDVAIHQFKSAKKNESDKLKTAEFLQQFNQLYQEFPDLLTNDIACSSGVCVASFSLATASDFDNISTRVDQITAMPNSRFYKSDGEDKSGNYQARFMFTVSESITAVMTRQ